MAKLYPFILFCILFVFLVQCDATDEERQEYIVYMGSLPKGKYSSSFQHYSILENVLEDSRVADYMVRSYNRSFNGFAAKLTNQERTELANMDGVVSVFPSRILQLHTTRSWDFLGLPESVKRQATVESDIIVGVIDTGIWPESESFSDEGFSPPPKKWKGICSGGINFTCSNKVIGARVYDSLSPMNKTARDTVGHGSHTASTAAGNTVKSASFYGLAQGNARGGVPSARIAAYKVCGDRGCTETDILSAFDDAISDGVDVITISLGTGSGLYLRHDAVAIGALHAMERGILTVNSAGNNGPLLASVVSIAPWILTVAASTTDRKIIDNVVFGNGKILTGASVNSFTLQGKNFSMVYGKDVTSQCSESMAQACTNACLDSKLVNGKIVLCNDFGGVQEAYKAGAIGMLGKSERGIHGASVVPLPASGLTAQDFDTILSYYNSTKVPQANILKSEAGNYNAAPLVASFSSRGPNPAIPDILKPDISAPGVEILAAYSPVASPSEDSLDKRSVKYSILSGTSMACPHAAGVAAYVKSFHPQWSPSAIKSAIMTTAWPMNATEESGGEFGFGSGHINPVKALNPGLVYETSFEDYINLLCDIGYDATAIGLVAGDNITCPNVLEGKKSGKDLNYPSMAAKVESNVPFEIEFPRNLTNVGIANSNYKAEIPNNSQINVTVRPSILSFNSLYENKSFVVIVSGKGLQQSMVSASLVWSDGTHSVHSPIVIYTDM